MKDLDYNFNFTTAVSAKVGIICNFRCETFITHSEGMILGKDGAPYLLKESSIKEGASMETSLHLVISDRHISAVI